MNMNEYPLPAEFMYDHPYNAYDSRPPIDDSIESNNNKPLPSLKFLSSEETQKILDSSFFARYPIGSVSSWNLKLVMNKVKKIYNDIPESLKDSNKYEYGLGLDGNVLTLFITLRPGR